MGKLIDTDALDEMLIKANVGRKSLEEFLKVLKNAPTIEAVPLVHGEWVKTFRYMRENANTGKIEPVYSYDCPICEYHTGNQGRNFNFCPNCGAKMDGKAVAE